MQEGLAEESSRSQKKKEEDRRPSQKEEEEGVFVVAMHLPNKRLGLGHWLSVITRLWRNGGNRLPPPRPVRPLGGPGPGGLHSSPPRTPAPGPAHKP
jgi:hypothetical protein